ncbi:hypothetical protein ACFFF5_21100 [Lederbergia wuyishanensis]|uniref:Signal transduction protein with GAF and PtsI domain n=1 Tax=Lederbergia wuyishanensis TaxID=1347903 RepID=A0ABU0D764_9BACI|nr:hypothetical protein [Lederbergia wuyishanensis]MCJ8008914.1 hypothetical protein [Lederbergia wuyishanensis]MDQ0344240.1 signal transduction protein with GAF and PtsI domain [Lederbergia wuyishanensis]
MNRFDKIIVNKDIEINTIGNYYKTGDVVYIKGENSEVYDIFKQLLRDRVFVKEMEFILEGKTSSKYLGRYMMLIDGEFVILENKEITIKR